MVKLSIVKNIVRSEIFGPARLKNIRAYICRGKFTRSLFGDYYNNVAMKNKDNIRPSDMWIIANAAF